MADYSSKELEDMLTLAQEMKKNPKEYANSLKGKSLGMIFSKHSTRTRISFETGIFQLGGQGLYFGTNDLQLARGESIYDTAKVLSRYLDGIMIRTYAHSDVIELAHHATIPIINGLTDYNHPCQVMADILTIKEKFGHTKGLKMVYIGDGNNMTRSLVIGAIKFGMDIHVVCPVNYMLEKEFQDQAHQWAKSAGTRVLFTHNIQEGTDGVDVVVTDTWTSMGQEKEREQRLRDFLSYQVDSKVMGYAKKSAIFMHCLPCHRGEEVSAEIIDGPQSVIFDEAENRLHAQKAVMYSLMHS